MSFLALDLGTTFIKGAVLDLDRLQLRQLHRLPFPGPLTDRPQLFYEVDPGTVVGTVRQLLHALLSTAPDCSGIVCCTQMHGLVLCTETGEARSNFITWQDQRSLLPHPQGGTHFARLVERVGEADRRLLGNEVQPSRPLCYLSWLAETGQLADAPLYPVGLPDFVFAQLCGAVPTMELTGAGAHCALDLTTGQWHYDLLARLGLVHLQWPTIVPFGTIVGSFAVGNREIPCYTPVGDHQCAVVGALLRADELSINISTGSQVSLVTPSLQLGDYQTRPFFDGGFLNTITGVPAGRALNHLVNLLTELATGQGIAIPDPWGYLAAAAATVATSDLDVTLAFFDSLGRTQGHITGIREHNLTVGHLFHAAFQNMAENYHTAALRLDPARQWRQLAFSGGLAQKIDILRTLIQRRFQTPYRLCATSEDTLLGLLALALVASGRVPTVQAAIALLQEQYQEQV
jgi:sugar (pentulose or hexulose) kinase